jgi:Holliday junction resolvasome RuvABC endonuclease subunit
VQCFTSGAVQGALHERKCKTYPVNVSSWKKAVVGKGNADKQMMYDSFVQDTGASLRLTITPDKKEITSPVSDVVDSYFICKKLFDSLTYPLGQ